jgi:hypothetical protein
MDEKPDELDSWLECLIGLVFWIACGISISAVLALLMWAAVSIKF